MASPSGFSPRTIPVGPDSPSRWRHSAAIPPWLAVLAGAGCGDYPRLDVARSWLARKKLPDGRWPLERVPGQIRTSTGEIGRPNKWITLRVLALSR
jgi:hypothetical protein